MINLRKNRGGKAGLARRMLSVFLALVLLAGVLTPAWAYDALGQVTSIVLEKNGRQITYYDIYNGKMDGRTDTDDQTQFYMDVVTQQDNYLKWLNLIYSIFDSEKNSYWDHAGNGWHADFGDGHYIDFIQSMQKSQSNNSGDDKWRSSGISIAESLSDVQVRAANDIASCIGRKLKGSDFVAHHDLEEQLKVGANQKVIYSTVACVDRYGKTAQYGYNAFAVAFYDFQVHLIDDGQALNTVTGDMSLDEAKASSVPGFSYSTDPNIDDGLISVSENNSLESSTTTVSLEESTSTSVSTSSQSTMDCNVGANIGVSATMSAKIPMVMDAGMTMSGGINFGESWSKGMTNGESETDSRSKSASTTITVPAHTVAGVNQTKSVTTMTTAYDCPVAVTYRVAVFSMCGTCYDDNAAVQSFSTSGYDQRTFFTVFGNDKDQSDAVENLYQRASKNVSNRSYEETYGTTYSSKRGGDQWCTSLNWDTILHKMSKAHTTSSEYRDKLTEHEEMVNRIINRYPMSLTGASTSCTETSINSSLTEPMPMYPIKYIYVNYQLNRDFILEVGDSLPIYSYRVNAYDESMVTYYGFVKGWGEWKIVDANGNPTSSNVAVMTTDPVTHQQCVVAQAVGTTYVKYFINEGVYTDYSGRVSKNSDITSPAYKVTVQDVPEEKFSGTIQLTGQVEAVVNEPVNLNGLEGITVAAYDSTGKQKDIQVKWEAQELEKNGIKVTEDGVLTATQPGTYHVRAFYQDVYSDWIPVTAVEAKDGVDALIISTQIHEEVGATVAPPKGAEFDPNTMLSRGEFIGIYHSLCGHAGEAAGASVFSDVETDAAYSGCLNWAKEKGIVNGVGGGKFEPDAGMTREQAATVLYNIAKAVGKVEALSEQEIEAALANAADSDQISAWAREAMAYAVQAGYLSTDEEGRLNGACYVFKDTMADVMMRMASAVNMLPDNSIYENTIQTDLDETLGEK